MTRPLTTNMPFIGLLLYLQKLRTLQPMDSIVLGGHQAWKLIVIKHVVMAIRFVPFQILTLNHIVRFLLK